MDFMYFEDEPGREDYPGDYSPEDDNLEDIDGEKDIPEDKVEDKIVIEESKYTSVSVQGQPQIAADQE